MIQRQKIRTCMLRRSKFSLCTQDTFLEIRVMITFYFLFKLTLLDVSMILGVLMRLNVKESGGIKAGRGRNVSLKISQELQTTVWSVLIAVFLMVVALVMAPRCRNRSHTSSLLPLLVKLTLIFAFSLIGVCISKLWNAFSAVIFNIKPPLHSVINFHIALESRL